MEARLPAPLRSRPVERIALGALAVFTVVTLAGYATFGVHPQLLARFPEFAGFYGFAFRFFALAHVWLAFAVLAVALVLRAGARWLPAFGVLYAISLSSELLGTTFGIPFGEYAYSTMLAPMWLDRVPVVIPLSWFFMAVPSYALAAWALPGKGRAPRILFASIVLLAWDLALDPAMSYATPYWIWGEVGPYYGMPLLNLFGWYVTGVLLMGALALLRADGWIARLPLRWLAGFYAANLLLPLGMAAAAGLWGAVAATLAALAATVLPFRKLLRAPSSARDAAPAAGAA